ncbi:MAG TPA: AMP-binding protein [Thermomonospora sp.]|nr:AMP-binding protein [Thermomonospora sp.]
MPSTTQDVPPDLRRILEHGVSRHASATVDTATPSGFRRVSYAEIGVRVAWLAHALRALGVGEGDRVGTYMWNNAAHLEAFLAVPCMGAVLHPLDVRPGEDVASAVGHAEDRVLIVDGALLPRLGALLPDLKTVEHVIVHGPLPDGFTAPAGMTVHDHAELLRDRPATYDWPEIDAGQAAVLSAGEPDSHRTIARRALALVEAFDLTEDDTLLLAVPHFEDLGLPYAAFLAGASLAVPDRFQSSESLAAFTAASRPNLGVGSPRVWEGLLPHAAALTSLTEVVAPDCPPALADAYGRHGVTLVRDREPAAVRP